MQNPPPEAPAFGAADLSNCEREQIHLAGGIQPHGALLSVRESDQTILQASANAQRFLNAAEPLQGRRLRDLGPDLWRRALETPNSPDLIPYVAPCSLEDGRKVNALLHRAPGGELVIELEEAGLSSGSSPEIERALQEIIAADSLQTLCDNAVRLFKEIAGYDRVMIYRFGQDGHGEVYAETRKPELEAFLGNRYPASDIPQIARRLYMRNRVRILADVDYAPCPVEPQLSPLSGKELDMSLCFLRSASPIHVQYLKNMGVTATLVVSLMAGEQLWGLVACHHYSPRFLPFELRSVCELLGEAVGTRIAALESFARGQCELAAKRLERRMVESLSRDGDWRGALFDGARSLLLPIDAGGAALLFEGQVQTIGDTPGAEAIRALADWLAPKLSEGVYATAQLPAQAPQFEPLRSVAAGLVAARISGDGSELLIWFRPERVRTLTWGGDPRKPFSQDSSAVISPRRSFAQWHEVVEGACEPWAPADIITARMIAASVTDVIVQFRAVQIVIAKDQLDRFSERVKTTEQLVIVADSRGRVLESNSAFERLVGAPPDTLRWLDDLPAYFADGPEIASRLGDLRQTRQSWRGEAQLRGGAPVLMRAEAIVARDERVLGFVLMFADLTPRLQAQDARGRFQESLQGGRQRISERLKAGANPKMRALIGQIIVNAQLAALEITDAADPATMRALLEGIRQSVERSAEVLERLSFPAD